jgi:hypothetical protein
MYADSHVTRNGAGERHLAHLRWPAQEQVRKGIAVLTRGVDSFPDLQLKSWLADE